HDRTRDGAGGCRRDDGERSRPRLRLGRRGPRALGDPRTDRPGGRPGPPARGGRARACRARRPGRHLAGRPPPARDREREHPVLRPRAADPRGRHLLRRPSHRARRPARRVGAALMPYAVPVIVLAVVTLVLLLGMLRGWRARSRRHPVPELPALPAAPHEPPIEGVYVASTLAGRPWERVVARGLGTRSAVEIRIVEP